MSEEKNIADIVPDLNMNQLVMTVLRYRDEIAELGRRKRVAEDDLAVVENEILRRLNDLGVQSIATDSGTAYLSENTKVRAVNWSEFFEFVKTQPDGHALVQQRPGSRAVQEYIESTGEIPPGVELIKEISSNVRRA